ncbi:MAG: SDR family NAD(P)-dependent oxidoreductase [Alphaproteobacteria bacterium]|nr:SDR family NAD(P)-dependent oxidoreductase [Alphaproteobacteria bacterium]
MTDTSKKLAGRIALVTGASRGIGWAVAKRFAAEGAHVIAVARTKGGLEALDDAIRAEGGEAITLVPMDLSDFSKIDQLGGIIHQRFGKLDILVGNAAMLGTLGPLSHAKPSMWEKVMNLNVTANYRLIRSFDPLLRLSDAGRAIFVTSSVGAKPRAYWGPYAASKAALESLVGSYAEELHGTNLRVNLIDPGKVRTGMRKEAYPGEDVSKLASPDDVTDRFVELALASTDVNGQRKAV